MWPRTCRSGIYRTACRLRQGIIGRALRAVMSITLPTLTFGLGCALLVIAIIGGGWECKEFKIPVRPIFHRALSGMLGAMLVALVLMKPGLIAALSNPPSD